MTRRVSTTRRYGRASQMACTPAVRWDAPFMQGAPHGRATMLFSQPPAPIRVGCCKGLPTGSEVACTEEKVLPT